MEGVLVEMRTAAEIEVKSRARDPSCHRWPKLPFIMPRSVLVVDLP